MNTLTIHNAFGLRVVFIFVKDYIVVGVYYFCIHWLLVFIRSLHLYFPIYKTESGISDQTHCGKKDENGYACKRRCIATFSKFNYYTFTFVDNLKKHR